MENIRQGLRLITLPFLFSSTITWAADHIRFSGFASAGLAISDNEEDYLLSRYNDEINYQSESIFGLQIDTRLNNKVRLSTQLIANQDSDFDVEAEWLYINYQLGPHTEVRSGRLRLPLFSASQYIHVRTSYLWIRPPAEVYNQAPFTRYHGIDIIHRIPFANTDIDLQLYTGKVNDDLWFFGAKVDSESEGLYGINIIAEGDNFSGRITYAVSDFSIHATVPVEIEVDFFSAGFQYEFNKWEIISEYARRNTDLDIIGDTDGAFITLGYSMGDWTPYLTLAVRNSKDNVPPTSDASSDSVTVGMRYDDQYGLTWKMDIHQGNTEDNATGLFTNSTIPEDPRVRLFRLSVSSVF